MKLCLLATTLLCVSHPAFAQAEATGASAEMYWNGGEALFEPRGVFYTTVHDDRRNIEVPAVLITDATDTCDDLASGKLPANSRSVRFALTGSHVGGYGINPFGVVWGDESGWAYAFLSVLDGAGEETFDARHADGASVAPYGQGLATLGSVGLQNAPGGEFLQGHMDALFGTEGYTSRRVQVKFNAQRCDALRAVIK